ncbi:uncharacterized protein LOC111896630 [Lactuca sativa]|uniref:uncharacterized protein LOC111896630 n=1 Tax=Lactuca sativa TaxID=4236 RepID=UPI000CD9D9CC|nr:uncharacterized protein LOC111896630 [Lactuca sativa]XP_052620594.1 uncharacterized protein LOC111896630 [Lactuca sativa]XP_052620595.1 uncharacterized protein LOC111896630 [Lactuca sativa]
MSYNSDDYLKLVDSVASWNNNTAQYLAHLWISSYQGDQQNRYSKPMPWIGMYIALASLFCIIAMVADLLHGFRRKTLWFPCKYFTLNSASLTVIAVAIKLPMDLSTLMPSYMDQATKLGSLGFMCTMMSNLLPSLATMDSKELIPNVISLAVLVITLVVNICIQLNTGALFYHVVDDGAGFDLHGYVKSLPSYVPDRHNRFTAAIYVGMLLMLLTIYVCSALAILKSKQILESKYQATHDKAINDQYLQQEGELTVEMLKQHVRYYWIMAGTGSSQFMVTCSVTTSASAVICASSVVLHILLLLFYVENLWDYKSDYKWSMPVILIIQFFGIIVGTISPLSRCFSAFIFKVSMKRFQNHIKITKVESYWTEKLYDWKQSSIPFPSSSRNCKIVMVNLKIIILNICIGFQMTVVVACKIIAVVTFFVVICVFYCIRCWKWLKAMFCTVPREKPERHLSGYVLQLQDDIEFANRTLKGMLKSVNHLIQKAEKRQPKNLMKLLAESRGFDGVEKFDSHRVQPLLSEEYLNCWSLSLVTLTSIAMSLPNIQKNKVDWLVSGVSEGLVYVRLVEECLNATDNHVSIQKAAKTLWVEVEVYHKWLGHKLPKHKPKVNTPGYILQWLRDTAKNKANEVESQDDNSIYKFICANSMYRITETILLSYHENIDEISQEELFAELSSMIADIFAACLTNLPQVIAMKCHQNAIEKREASVQAAAQLLGETTQIINSLQVRELPRLNPDELAFIDKWRAYLHYKKNHE